MIKRSMPLLTMLLVLCASLSPAPSAFAQDLPALQAGVRVYDETGTSLTADQTRDLEQRLVALAAVGPDAVVVIRNLMATPDETLEQVENIQQAWASTAGIGDTNAVAILINRNPEKSTDARAGIYVGKNLNDGNIPDGEQRAIVDDELIPPLRNGDVYTSLTNGITRLETSYLNGPPKSSFEKWSTSAAKTWLIPVGLALAAVLAGAITWLFRKREAQDAIPLPPSTVRPDNLAPAVGAALALGGAQPSAIPASILTMAEQDRLRFVLESEGGRFSNPKIGVQLDLGAEPDDRIDQVIWRQLRKRDPEGAVSSKGLVKVAADPGPAKRAVDEILIDQGWKTPALTHARNWIIAPCLVAAALAVFGLIIAVTSGHWISLAAAVALAATGVYGIWAYVSFSPWTVSGQYVAAPWKAYQKGLKSAFKQQSTPLDLNAVLIDAVALNLGNDAKKRVEAAQDMGIVLNAFAGSNLPVVFPVWLAFNSSIASASGTSTVSGGGAGGGGGAAGST